MDSKGVNRTDLNVMIKILKVLLIFVFLPVAPARAADPSPDVLAAMKDTPIVIELFSSQACVFCPQADRLFADLVQQPGVIGLACHVDYFDVATGALSQPFCTTRQSWYMDILAAGPNYTPQMVIDGTIDVVGYKHKKVTEGLAEATQNRPLVRIDISPTAELGSYLAEWKPPEQAQGDIAFFLIKTDKPHDVVVADGRNKGQRMSYMNIASAFDDLGTWPQAAGSMRVPAALTAQQQGFVLLAQNRQTGEIVAAGQYKANNAE